ncbi:MAG: hypothetical protein MUO21_01880 [Nitrososphaeraceae archaeon]|nr:hypothetical protein [Nitrososphaeraceae archaeon]
MDQNKPSEKFYNQLVRWNAAFCEKGIMTVGCIQLSPDCKHTRIIAGTVVMDIHWYPITEIIHRDWYDVRINSMYEIVHFVGKCKEIGRNFHDILNLAEITTKSTTIDPQY